MPTLLRLGPYRVAFHSNDHQPAHVHVVGNGGVAVFNLHRPDGPAALREARGLGAHEVNRVVAELGPHLTALRGQWRLHHGDF